LTRSPRAAGNCRSDSRASSCTSGLLKTRRTVSDLTSCSISASLRSTRPAVTAEIHRVLSGTSVPGPCAYLYDERPTLSRIDPNRGPLHPRRGRLEAAKTQGGEQHQSNGRSAVRGATALSTVWMRRISKLSTPTMRVDGAQVLRRGPCHPPLSINRVAITCSLRATETLHGTRSDLARHDPESEQQALSAHSFSASQSWPMSPSSVAHIPTRLDSTHLPAPNSSAASANAALACWNSSSDGGRSMTNTSTPPSTNRTSRLAA